MKTSARERAKRRPQNEDNSPADEEVVGVIGLGYVGLPIAVEFGKQMKTVGFELSAGKVASLR